MGGAASECHFYGRLGQADSSCIVDAWFYPTLARWMGFALTREKLGSVLSQTVLLANIGPDANLIKLCQWRKHVQLYDAG